MQGDTGALTCIGDDDQAIYAFKGCSSKFMLAFSERHPGAQVILCRKNYRSTKGIVDFSNSILRKMNKDARIPKEIVYAEYAKEGEKPYLVENNRIETLDSIISSVIADGYRYEDIAIIATTNASLGVLHDTLKAPSELASAYIVNDFLFQVVMNCLALVTKADATLNPYFRLGHVFEKDKAWMDDVNCRSMRRDEVYELLMFAKKLAETPAHFVTRLAAYLDMDESNSEKAVLGIAEQCNGSLMEFYQTMYDMRFFGEGKKIEYPIKDKVTLITSHSCKGMEWPVVIVYDTENFYAEISADGKYSMDARLFYVAASRAKEHLYFLKQEGSETLIDDSEFITRKRVAS